MFRGVVFVGSQRRHIVSFGQQTEVAAHHVSQQRTGDIEMTQPQMAEVVVQLSGCESYRRGCRQSDGKHGTSRFGAHLLFHDEFLSRQLLQFHRQIDGESVILRVVDIHHEVLLRRLLIYTGLRRHNVVYGTEAHHNLVGGLNQTAHPEECGAHQGDG